MTARVCKACEGLGLHVREAFDFEGKHYPRDISTCRPCGGQGVFIDPDEAEIEAAIKGRKGLRTSRPADSRAYYVWRMARFHGGVDMTMPVMAGVEIRGDPFQPELEAMADKMARKYFGSDLHAAKRWGRALGVLP